LRHLLHFCFDSENETLPESCSCHFYLSTKERDVVVRDGRAVEVDGRNIVLKRRLYQKPQTARTVSDHDIELAYVENVRSARERIEVFGPNNM
jgi:hypothetical protein